MPIPSAIGFLWPAELLQVVQGNYWGPHTVAFQDGGTPVDWTGATAALHVLDGDDLVVVGNVDIPDPTSGEIEVWLDEGETALCKTGHALILAVEDAAGRHLELARGHITASPRGIQP